MTSPGKIQKRPSTQTAAFRAATARKRTHPLPTTALTALSILIAAVAAAHDTNDIQNIITGPNAFTDFTKEKPATFRKITQQNSKTPRHTTSRIPRINTGPNK